MTQRWSITTLSPDQGEHKQICGLVPKSKPAALEPTQLPSQLPCEKDGSQLRGMYRKWTYHEEIELIGKDSKARG